MGVLGVAGSFGFYAFGFLDCFGRCAEVFAVRDEGGAGLGTGWRGGKPDYIVSGSPEGVFVSLGY